MAANTFPIFTKQANVGIINAIATANTTKDLTSGTIYLVFTAGSEGSYVRHLRIRPAGTNVATVIRIWLNNGATTGTAANNNLYDEVTVAATTNSETASIVGTEVPLGFLLPASWRIYLTTGTGVTAMFATVIGGDL